MKLNFEDLEMQKRNICTDGAQRVDERNMVMCLIIMFIILMPHFFLFSVDDRKKLVKVWANYLKAPKILS